MPFTWTPPDPLDNTATTRSIYITELQSAVNTKRAEIGQAPLSFIDQFVGTTFRLDAIEELKTRVNQLALDFGYTGGVTNPALLGRNYISITKKYGKEVAHYPIINDLRLVLNSITVKVSLYMDYILNFSYPLEDKNLANLTVATAPALKSLAKSEYAWNERCRVCCDSSYVYRSYPSGTGDTFIYKEDILTGTNIALKQITSFVARDICVDNNYIYVTGYINLGGGSYSLLIKRLDKSDLGNLITLITIDPFGNNYAFNQGMPSIICDANYLYVTVSKKETPPGPPWTVLFTRHGGILRYSKTGGGPSEFLYRENYVSPEPPGPNGTDLSAITIDANYLYVNYYERNYPLAGPPYQSATKILKIKISDMSVFDNWNGGATVAGGTSLTMASDYIFELSRASVWGITGDCLFTAYDKFGGILNQDKYVAGYYLGDLYVDNRMASSDEFLLSF